MDGLIRKLLSAIRSEVNNGQSTGIQFVISTEITCYQFNVES